MTSFGPLLAKELRQLRRSRSALLSATLLPLFLMVVTPIGQYLSLRGAPERVTSNGFVPPGLAEIQRPEDMLTLFLLPLLMAIVGLIVPSTAAVHAIVAERDRRSIELLVALPVGVRDILLAKLVAMIVLSLIVVLPLFAIDAAFLLLFDLASVGHVGLLLALLLAGLVCSVSLSLLISLLARDMRTANQINGALVGPVVLLMLGALLFVPGPLRWPTVVGLLLLVAVAGVVVSLRWLTFERYLA